MQLSDLFTSRMRDLLPPLWGPGDANFPSRISLAFGDADPTMFPREELLGAIETTLAEDIDAALNYGPTYPGLVAIAAERLRRRGIPANEKNTLVSYGSSQIIGLLPQVLVEPGDTVIVEAPSFLGAVMQFRRAGARLVGIPVDAEGMDVELLATTLASLQAQGIRPKFIYTIPTFQNPTGATLSLARRKRLLELAMHYGVLVVEDDAYSDLRFRGEEVPPIAALGGEGWVIHLRTFSKILAPGVRLGWASGPQALIDRLEICKVEGSSGPFITRVVARYAADGRLDTHIAALRASYSAKCDLMLAALAREIPGASMARPDGGFFIWLRLPPGLSAGTVVPTASEFGVDVLAGPRCFADGSGDEYIRLAFSYATAAQIGEGVARLGAAVRSLL
ncbi:MAG: PLP-dependent aminotransferase family protein [Oscillochloris sp.]|nr:PLP-dependent aminotransferase family protein [Oscillochloris sp.]